MDASWAQKFGGYFSGAEKLSFGSTQWPNDSYKCSAL